MFDHRVLGIRVNQLREVHGQKLFPAISRDVLTGAIDVAATISLFDENGRGNRVRQGPEFLLALSQRLFRAAMFVARALLFEDPGNDQRQALHLVFQDVIRDPVLHAFDGPLLLQCSGYKDERNVALFGAQKIECVRTGPRAYGVIGQHNIVGPSVNSIDKFGPSFRHVEMTLPVGLFQNLEAEPFIVGVVFEKEYSYRSR